MNCKQGDMAVVVRSNADNEGRVVTCMEFIGPVGIIEHEGVLLMLAQGDYWRIDQDINLFNRDRGFFPDFAPYVRDSCLMPISGYKEPMVVKEEECEPA